MTAAGVVEFLDEELADELQLSHSPQLEEVELQGKRENVSLDARWESKMSGLEKRGELVPGRASH